MADVGRPFTNIDKEQFEGLCRIQCTQKEIAEVLCCDEDTVNAWCKRTYGHNFSVIYKQKSAGGKTSLRRKQWKLADTSTAMAIFLGKNYLGQSDKIEYNDNGNKLAEYKAIFEMAKVNEDNKS